MSDTHGDFTVHDRVRVGGGQEGIVYRVPRAGAVNICVQLDGVKTPKYFPAAELSKVRAPAPVIPPAAAAAPVSPTPEVRSDVTLPELIATRQQLRFQLDQFEQTLIRLQVESVVSSALAKAIPPSGLRQLQVLSGDAAKIKADTATALAAAKRLFPS